VSAMAGTIELRGLRVVGIVGVLAEERDRAQPLEIDLDIAVDLSTAAASDGLDDTVDYGAVCDLVDDVVATARPRLLERLAVVVAEAVIGSDPRIDAVEVSVRKLRPPVAHDLSSSGVRVRVPRAAAGTTTRTAGGEP
jgi:7,8-dihydroneopterin aldolase/epimerase/oxygenase